MDFTKISEPLKFVAVLHSFCVLPTVTRVRSQGCVTVSMSVVTKDLWKQGYRNGAKEPMTNGPTFIKDSPTTYSRSKALPDRTL